MISDRGFSVRDAERTRLSKLIKYANMFADLDEYRAQRKR